MATGPLKKTNAVPAAPAQIQPKDSARTTAASVSKAGVIIELGSKQTSLHPKQGGDGFDAGPSRAPAYERCIGCGPKRWPVGA